MTMNKVTHLFIMRFDYSNKQVWLLLVILLTMLLIKRNYVKIENLYKTNLMKASSRIPEAASTTVSTTLPAKTTATIFTKNIYISFGGRFGNVIFQFLAAYSMTLRAGCKKMYFRNNGQSKRLRTFFPKMDKLMNDVPRAPATAKSVWELHCNKYDPKTTETIAKATSDVHLRGFLGVAAYWYPECEKEVREILTVSDYFQNRARQYLFELASKQNASLEKRKDSLKSGVSPKLPNDLPVLVGIQARRGDMLTASYGWRVPGKEYFDNAMNHFRAKFKSIYFIVVCQDKIWGKSNIVGNDVIHSTSTDDLLELALLTLCDHGIVSVGTFSWWSAYLTGGDVAYYRDHLKPKGEASIYYNETQYFLPHWKAMV